MFYLLKENRDFLIDLWNDVTNNEDIDPYSELNIDLIENFNTFFMPDADIPLLFIDEEFGICGCAVLTPLETIDQHSNTLNHNARWVLHTVKLHIKKTSSISLHPKAIDKFKEKFYSHLRQVLLNLLQYEQNKSIMILSENWNCHEDIMNYLRFVLRDLPYQTENSIIGIVSDIRDYDHTENHIKDHQEDNNIIYLKRKVM